jgi:rare lipoprotein A
MRFLLFLLLAGISFSVKAQDLPDIQDRYIENDPAPGMRLSDLKPMYGVASYYAEKFNGRETANGDHYDSNRLSAACNRVPLGTWLRVTNLRNKRVVIVRVNDRLHPKNKRIVDLSRLAARNLGYIGNGLTQVKVEVLVRKAG